MAQCVGLTHVPLMSHLARSTIDLTVPVTRVHKETDLSHVYDLDTPWVYLSAYSHFCSLAIAPIEPECKVDPDCPLGLACINAECQDQCQVNRPCHNTQTCKVENSSPIRTVICVCSDDSFIRPKGQCKAKGE